MGPSDKITITLQPPLPSLCCICNFSADGKRRFLDFQMSIDIYGAVVICEECIAPVATLFGFVPIDRLETAETYLAAASINLQGYRKQNEQLNLTLDSIFNLRPDFASSDTRNELLAHKNLTENTGQSEPGFEVSGRSDSGSDESNAVGRSEDISHSKSDASL